MTITAHLDAEIALLQRRRVAATHTHAYDPLAHGLPAARPTDTTAADNWGLDLLAPPSPSQPQSRGWYRK